MIYKGLNPIVTILQQQPITVAVHLVKKTKGKQPRNIHVIRPIRIPSRGDGRFIFIELTGR